MCLKPYQPAPEFTAEAVVDDGKFTKISLADYKGKWVVLCYDDVESSVACGRFAISATGDHFFSTHSPHPPPSATTGKYTYMDSTGTGELIGLGAYRRQRGASKNPQVAHLLFISKLVAGFFQHLCVQLPENYGSLFRLAQKCCYNRVVLIITD